MSLVLIIYSLTQKIYSIKRGYLFSFIYALQTKQNQNEIFQILTRRVLVIVGFGTQRKRQLGWRRATVPVPANTPLAGFQSLPDRIIFIIGPSKYPIQRQSHRRIHIPFSPSAASRSGGNSPSTPRRIRCGAFRIQFGIPPCQRRSIHPPPSRASRGVDAASTGPWIAEPSGVTRTTAGERPWPPRPRPRPRSPGRPRPRRARRRRTRASARRCCRRRSAGPTAAPRARASPSRPSGASSGRTNTARSSPRSSSSSPVIQVTRMMNTWILAYAQSCKYRRPGSPVQLAQVESMMIV